MEAFWPKLAPGQDPVGGLGGNSGSASLSPGGHSLQWPVPVCAWFLTGRWHVTITATCVMTDSARRQVRSPGQIDPHAQRGEQPVVARPGPEPRSDLAPRGPGLPALPHPSQAWRGEWVPPSARRLKWRPQEQLLSLQGVVCCSASEGFSLSFPLGAGGRRLSSTLAFPSTCVQGRPGRGAGGPQVAGILCRQHDLG